MCQKRHEEVLRGSQGECEHTCVCVSHHPNKLRVCVLVFRALKALWQYLGARGINTTLIWEKIKDIVIKTVIA